MGRKKVIQNNPGTTEGLLSTAEMCKAWNCLANYLENCSKQGMPRTTIDGVHFYDLKKCQHWYATTGTMNPGWSRPEGAECLLTYDELCELWFYDRKLIKKYVDKGMPAKNIGKRRFFDLEKCQEWMMEGGIKVYAKKTNPQPKIQI